MHKRYSISEKIELLEKWLRSKDKLQQDERIVLEEDKNGESNDKRWKLLVESNLLISENSKEHIYFIFSYGNTRESAVEDGLKTLNRKHAKCQMSWQSIELQLTIEGVI